MKKCNIISADKHLSTQLQIGKAGEHFVCFDLIRQGYNAFLAYQGLPYDIIADIKGKLFRIQVKTTLGCKNYGKTHNVYRFNLRSAKKGKRKIYNSQIDTVAFVAIDIKCVAYLMANKIISPKGHLITCLDFRDKNIPNTQCIYSNGTIRRVNKNAKFLQDFKEAIFYE